MDEKDIDPKAEIAAMQKIADAFSELKAESIARVLRWATDHYGASFGSGFSAGFKGREGVASSLSLGDASIALVESIRQKFGELAELYSTISPTIDSDRALVVAYWFQYIEDKPDFVSQEINSALKHLGHGVSNITSAFNDLMTRKPALVMQVKKTGTTQQARKKYRLTSAGKSAVEAMIDQH